MRIVVMIYLCVNAWTDGKRKEIDLRYTLGYLFVFGVFCLAGKDRFLWEGIGPGFCLWLLSLRTRSGIGRGDGPVIMALGGYWGLRTTICILTGGFFLAGGVGILCMIAGKRKAAIPFFPWLLGSYVVQMIFG